MLNPC